MKPQRIAIIHDKQQYGEGLARSVQDSLESGKANIVFFDGITAGEKDFSRAGFARLEKRKYRLCLLRRLLPGNGANAAPGTFRRAENPVYGTRGRRQCVASLTLLVMPLRRRMLVTMPKRYDQDPANKAIVDALKVTKKRSNWTVRGSLMQPSSHWRQQWIAAVAKSRWTW